LPTAYENARRALAECARVDECQDWANRAAALASYARQADDETLCNYATRIKARAIRRGGALLAQVEPQNRSGMNQHTPRDGTDPRLTRESAANAAGISERQRKTMLRVAAVPDADFERQIESDTPPTITALAEQGKRAPHLGTSTPVDFRYATKTLATLRRFAEFAESTDPVRAALGVQPKEFARARADVRIVDEWLDAFVVSIGSQQP
jgi:hypothetical protein